MFTEPKIISTEDLTKRSYITFYFNGQRVREYSGNNINKSIFPNRASSVEERNKLLQRLKFEFQLALEGNSYPSAPLILKGNSVIANIGAIAQTASHNTNILLQEALNKKLHANLSKTYKRNMRNIHRQFIEFLSEDELQGDISLITPVRIEQFLSRFKSSGTYYMDKRRDLGVLFSSVGRSISKTLNVVKATERMRVTAKLHKIYDIVQLKPIFNYLKLNQPNVYLCCLLTYGSWLRPHEEVRLLTKGHFKKDCTEIHLSGSENKGGKVRVVYVPDYIRVELLPILLNLQAEDNIFTRCPKPFNDAYFNTQWKRVWDKMYKLSIIHKNQTIYSFRHTAAVEIFKRSKDVYLLQKLLGHSTIVVTLKYLRNLGEFDSDELKSAAPSLEL